MNTVPQNGQVGVWGNFFFAPACPRPNSKRAIIDERRSKISEDLIYFCDSGSPFSEKMCQNCCKGCQILTSRYLLPRSAGSAEVPGASAARDLPSTCAGGQDDVSSQANSLDINLFFCPYSHGNAIITSPLPLGKMKHLYRGTPM